MRGGGGVVRMGFTILHSLLLQLLGVPLRVHWLQPLDSVLRHLLCIWIMEMSPVLHN